MELIIKTNNGNIKCHTETPLLVPSKCRSCQKQIYWVKTQNGKNMPIEMINNSEFQSHFVSCPQGDKWRKTNE